MAKILILGGTTEARALSGRLEGHDVVLSLAGRTMAPAAHPVPVRVGGFGGAAGLAAFLRDEGVERLVDATHPFAARISRNAAEAAAAAGVPVLALRRPAWARQPGDRWHEVADADAAVAALGDAPRRVFLALGRQEARCFEAAAQHDYLVRSVDPIDPPLALPRVETLLARGPFDPAAEHALLRDRGIEAVVCKNSGGAATFGKIAAARALGIPVVMLRRPPAPAGVEAVAEVDAVLRWIAHAPGAPPADRGE